MKNSIKIDRKEIIKILFYQRSYRIVGIVSAGSSIHISIEAPSAHGKKKFGRKLLRTSEHCMLKYMRGSSGRGRGCAKVYAKKVFRVLGCDVNHLSAASYMRELGEAAVKLLDVNCLCDNKTFIAIPKRKLAPESIS